MTAAYQIRDIVRSFTCKRTLTKRKWTHSCPPGGQLIVGFLGAVLVLAGGGMMLLLLRGDSADDDVRR
jgi:hypothetical protein